MPILSLNLGRTMLTGAAVLYLISVLWLFGAQLMLGVNNEAALDSHQEILWLVSSFLNAGLAVCLLILIRRTTKSNVAQEWQDTFDAISDMIFILDTDHKILKVNAAFARAMNKSPHELVDKYCFEVMHCASHPWEGCPFEVTKKDGLVHTAEVNDPNIGKPLWVTTSPIFDSGRKMIGAVHVAKDITEFKKAEKELERAAEIKVAFTSMVSHELRTPLTAIREGINMVMEGVAGQINPEQQELLRIAKNNVDRLARMINNVLDFQKLNAGKMEFDFKENDINAVILEATQTMSLMAGKKTLTIAVKVDDTLPKGRFDKDKIMQVIVNLVSNAIKYTEEGMITVGSCRTDKGIQVSVKDTGTGIKSEDMPKLFQQFEQLASINERKTGGTGLGLAISRQIVKCHDGEIWAESGPGKGTTFYFVLPVIADKEEGGNG